MASIISETKVLECVDYRVPATPFKLGYRPELDGLRGISILLVFIHHLSGNALPGGFLGVDIFFVLSGFLITSLLVEEWDRRRSISLKRFYIRRALRLMPAVLVLLLICLIFSLVFMDVAAQREMFQGAWLTLSYGSNWFYAFQFTSANNPLGITWSLAVEEQFYLVWPLILAVILGSNARRRLVIYFLVLAILLIALHRKVMWDGGASVARLYYASDTRADALLIGCLISLLCSWRLWPRNRYFELLMKSAAGLASLFFFYMLATASFSDPLLYGYAGFTMVSVAAGLILTVLVQFPPALMLSVLRFGPLAWLGRIAYGLYLWHWPVRMLVYQRRDTPPTLQLLFIAAALSILMTVISYYFIEKPFLRWKKHFA